MLYTINELRDTIFSQVHLVYQIFVDFFKEEYVDIQGIAGDSMIVHAVRNLGIAAEPDGRYDIPDIQLDDIKESFASIQPYIYVWWPKVTVTNEHNKSVEIQDLYAKIKLTMEGRIPYENYGFQLERSTFSDIQFVSGYIHSHVPGRYRMDEEVGFQDPCLGTGPIGNTIADLKNDCDEIAWMLFCEELSRYVTVESLTGGPYRKLEEIGRKAPMKEYTQFEDVDPKALLFFDKTHTGVFERHIRTFTDYYLSLGTLQLCFINGRYQCGMHFFDFMIDISNAFISWFNQSFSKEDVEPLFTNKWLIKTFVVDGKFYSYNNLDSTNLQQYEGRHVLWFKGEDIKLKIFSTSSNNEEGATLILNKVLALSILNNILRIIDYHYGNKPKQLPEAGGNQNPAQTDQTICYI